MKIKNNFHPHLWGGEIHLVNTELYCGKLICLKIGYQSSYHFHNIKDETFFCLFGDIKLELGEVKHWANKIKFAKSEKEVILKPGDSIRFKPGQCTHRFQAIKENETKSKGPYLKQMMNYLKLPYPVKIGIITNVYDAVLLEVSTHDYPDDNVKLEKARKVK